MLKGVINILSYIIGGFDETFFVLVIVLIIDFLTNICVNIYQKKNSKIINLKYFIKVGGYFLILVFAEVIDKILVKESMMRQMIVYFFVASIGINVMEACLKRIKGGRRWRRNS